MNIYTAKVFTKGQRCPVIENTVEVYSPDTETTRKEIEKFFGERFLSIQSIRTLKRKPKIALFVTSARCVDPWK